jgi:DMSO reductase anchor subunit
MHPAFSVIIFTTLSGAGYGLLWWLGLYAAASALPDNRIFAAASLVLALGAVAVGLISSTFHLGHPERAWRAFSQWRSSWLSREGVASTLSFIPALAFAAGWVLFGRTGDGWALAALLTSVLSLVSVVCTAYIYRSLKPIPAWYNGWVLPCYLSIAAMSGAIVLVALARLFGQAIPQLNLLAFVTIGIALFCKLGYWRHIDSLKPRSTAGTATGLAPFGEVRLFEAPHTSENYLLKEMGFRIARKHARKLRMIAIVLGFLAPAMLLAVAFFAPAATSALLSIVAVIAAFVGILTERWLFFAEAKHSVTLYYGTPQV